MPPKMMVPVLAEMCWILQIPNVFRNAISAQLGVPQAAVSVQLLTSLSDAERENTVDHVELQDAQGNVRLPSFFEKAQIRSLFMLADQKAASLLWQIVQAQPAPVAAAGPQNGGAPPCMTWSGGATPGHPMTPVTPPLACHKDNLKLMICADYEFLDEEWERMRPICKWGKRYFQIWINIKLNSFLAAGAARCGFVMTDRLPVSL